VRKLTSGAVGSMSLFFDFVLVRGCGPSTAFKAKSIFFILFNCSFYPPIFP